MRPINSIVDASNYVMLELGQPNHTYDLAKVDGGALRVRWARDGEHILTLDDVDRELDQPGRRHHGRRGSPGRHRRSDGWRVDRDRRHAPPTVLLEMAWWEPMAIARSSKRLGLRSEASMRFERGTDPEVIDLAGDGDSPQLVLEPVAASWSAARSTNTGSLPERPEVELRTAQGQRVAGDRACRPNRSRDYLEPIGFECQPTEFPDVQSVRVPSFRPDSSNETDVIEEVARHHGYSKIPRTLPAAVTAGSLSERQQARRMLRQVLVGLAIDEALPMPFLAPGRDRGHGQPHECRHHHEPARGRGERAAHLAAARACSRPSPTTNRTDQRVCGCSRSPRCSSPPTTRSSCPTSRSSSPWRWPVPRRPRRSTCGG